MSTTDTSEKGLERLIEIGLVADAGYESGASANFDKSYCVDKPLLLRFLRSTQPNEIAKLEHSHGTLFEDKFLKDFLSKYSQKASLTYSGTALNRGRPHLPYTTKNPPPV